MSEDQRATLAEFIGRQSDPQPSDPAPANNPTSQRGDQYSRLWLVLAAHARGLEDAGVIDERSTIAVAGMLERVSAAPPGSPAGSLRRLAASIEERVDAALPAELVGAVTLGIAREDWTATATRIGLRNAALAATDAAIRMQSGMIAMADLHSVSLMQGFHTGRPAQPVTFGHLMGGAIAPAGRGIARLQDQLDRLNRSPLGAGTMSGEVVGAERQESAAWLGFGGTVPNTFDAVANVEDIAGTLDAISAVAAPVARMLDELAMLIRTDPSSLVLDDEWMREDAHLPGFRAAEGLVLLAADLRGLSAEASSLVVRLRSLPYGPLGAALDWIDEEVGGLLARAETRFLRVEALFRSVLTVNRAYLANRAGRAYTTSSDLSAFLMTEEQLPPSVSRNIASLTMRRLREENLEMSQVTPEMVDTASMLVIGRELKVEVETLGRWFAPRRFLERRLVEGSPAPSKTREWLQDEQQQNRLAADQVASRRLRARDAEGAVWAWVVEKASESDD